MFRKRKEYSYLISFTKKNEQNGKWGVGHYNKIDWCYENVVQALMDEHPKAVVTNIYCEEIK